MNAPQKKLRNLVVLLLVLFLGLQIALWFSSTGLRNLRELNKDLSQQERENAELLLRNQTLEAEVSDLKSGLESIEERARYELGMIAPEETFFQLIEKNEPDGVKKRIDRDQDGSKKKSTPD